MNPRSVMLVVAAASVLVLAVAFGAGPAARALSIGRGGEAVGPQHDLDAARDAWKAAGLSAYRYDVRRECFCEPQDSLVVMVRERRPAKFPKGLTSAATVPCLFDLIQRAIDDGQANLHVSYGPHGVPHSIGVDAAALAHDGGVRYTVARFTAAP